nr:MULTISPECIES: tetratricopeptide repeat protein [Pseudooceanicola]
MALNIYRKAFVAGLFATSLLLAGGAGAEGREEALLKALKTADAGDAAQIERELELIWSRSGSPSMDLLLRRGEDAIEAGDMTAAIGHLSALVDHAPDFAEAYRMRAQAFYQEGELGLAMQDLARCVSLNPYNYEAAFGIAMILEQTGRVDAAYRGFLSVLQVYPGHEGAREGLDRVKTQVSERDI